VSRERAAKLPFSIRDIVNHGVQLSTLGVHLCPTQYSFNTNLRLLTTQGIVKMAERTSCAIKDVNVSLGTSDTEMTQGQAAPLLNLNRIPGMDPHCEASGRVPILRDAGHTYESP
jgi:hypothetical protein